MKSFIAYSVALLALAPLTLAQAEPSGRDVQDLAVQWIQDIPIVRKPAAEDGVIELVFNDGLSEVKVRIRGKIESIEGRDPQTQTSNMGTERLWDNPHNPTRLSLTEVRERPAKVKGSETPEKPKARLGIFLDEVPESLAHQLGVDPAESMMINSVNEGGAAEAAGLEKFDVIVQVGDSEGGSRERLRTVLDEKSPGDVLDVTVMRRGERITCGVTLEAKPEEASTPTDVTLVYPQNGYVLYGNAMGEGVYTPQSPTSSQGDVDWTEQIYSQWLATSPYEVRHEEGLRRLGERMQKVEEQLTRIEALLTGKK